MTKSPEERELRRIAEVARLTLEALQLATKEIGAAFVDAQDALAVPALQDEALAQQAYVLRSAVRGAGETFIEAARRLVSLG